MKIGIVMLTHNAPNYCWTSINSIRQRTPIPHELVVVDNASGLITKAVLFWLFLRGRIQKLIFSSTNLMFSVGNNLGARNLGADVTHILLLNSDIKVKRSNWLQRMLDIHKPGITGLRLVESIPNRADGFCLLIDRSLYDQHPLDESFPWWWSITKLQADVLKSSFSVQAVKHHESFLHHYGGKSGDAAKFLTVEQAIRQSQIRAEVQSWFDGYSVHVVENLEEQPQ